MGLNEGQRKAVEAKGRDLMVSASAGTGKTYSLCQRVLASLTSGERSIDRLLIITFTNAAAAELRNKLAKELKKAIAEETDPAIKAELKHQRSLLPSAKISTIDSFCYDLVKENFSQLGVSPGVRIIDNTELAPIRLKLMENAVRQMYSSDKKEAFSALIENLAAGYSGYKLYDTLICMYTDSESLTEGISCLKKAAEEMRADAERPFEDTMCGRIIAEKNRELFSDTAKFYRWMLDNRSDVLEAGHVSVLEEQYKHLVVGKQKSGDLKAQTEALDGVRNGGFTVTGFEDNQTVQFIAALRSKLVNALVTKPETRCLDFDIDRYKEFYLENAAQTEALYALLEKYENALMARKKKMGVLTFADIERLAYRLLCGENGEKTPFAEKYAEGFDELFIDEYQDVNELQDRLFASLSRQNRFVVGDVKQSIYGFRGSRPDIFNRLRRDYADLDAPGAATGKVFLEENFRSSKQILTFVNAAIGPLMRAGGEIEYIERDDLKPGVREGAGITEGPLPTLCFVPKNDPRWAGERPEAVYLAKSVAKMIENGEKPGDIAVLTRSKNDAREVRKALANEGIETVGGSADNLLNAPEVLLMRALIECVDNPTKDIPLAGAMRSPVFGFTLDDIAKIRAGGRGESLYSALNDFYITTGDERCGRVLTFLAGYRKKAREWQGSTIVFRMMDELMVLPLLCAGKNPAQAARIKDNILCFYDIVRELSGKDLGSIAAHIAYLAEEKKQTGKASPDPLANEVRVMTIHASKGLEFKVCWLYNADRSIKIGGRSDPFSQERGVALRLRDDIYPWVKNNTPMYTAQKIRTLAENRNEELRLLYVALTRAVEKLYVSCLGEKKDFEKLSVCPPEMLFPALLEAYPSYMKWLALSLGGRKDLYKEYDGELPFDEAPEETPQAKEAELPDKTAGEGGESEYTGEMAARMDFVYPHGAAVDLPAKLAVSKLSPSVLDDEGEEDGETPGHFAARTGLKPSFIREKEGGSRKTAAEIGTATHAFMQFCDFGNLEKEGFDKEAKRLTENGFLSPSVAADVEKDAVERFLESRLYAELKKARKVYREQRFMIALPAAEFTASEEKKKELQDETLLVQGVIDCFFEDENGEIILFDYKTDHFTDKELKDLPTCRETLIKRHSQQLSYYREAILRMIGRETAHTYIYSFALGEAIEVDL